MPKGPKGERRPAGVIENAVHVMKIATGEIEAESSPMPGRAKGGKAGGAARAKAISPERRREIARKAAESRWAKLPSSDD